MLELIDPKVMLEKAQAAVNSDRNFAFSSDEWMKDMTYPETCMYMGFTWTLLLANQFEMPKESRDKMLRCINNRVQKIAEEEENNKKMMKEHAAILLKTDETRTKLTKEIKAGDFDTALTDAVKLVDMYTFGGNRRVNSKILREARKEQKAKCRKSNGEK